ncbi:MAG: PucR family transcriptional regulator [Rhodoglobus sp.]
MSNPLSTPQEVGVRELLHILDGCGLRLETPESQLHPLVAGTSLFDPLTPLRPSNGGILLGIGIHPAGAESAQIVRDAADAGFTALIIKSFSESCAELAEVAAAASIDLLAVDDDIEWRQLDSLISSALASTSDAHSGDSNLAVGDLFALANAIAAMTGGAAAIEDMQEHVLAYSTIAGQPIDDNRRDGILGRQVPRIETSARVYAELFRAEGARRMPRAPDSLGRLAVAIRAGTQPLGSIWVVDADGSLAPDAERAIERAADVAALHLLRARSSADLARAQRTELLRRLLEGSDSSHLIASQMGCEPQGAFVVLACQPALSESVNEMELSRLVDLIRLHCQSHQQSTECITVGTTVYALFSGPAALDLARINSIATKLIARAGDALTIDLKICVGTSATGSEEIYRSRVDADLGLTLLSQPQFETSLVDARDARSQLALLEISQLLRENPRLVSDAAQQMIETDTQTGTEYAKTLSCYLDNARDSAVTALALSVHQNTLRYRLRRASELFNLDLTNADDTLLVWLSLRAVELH